MNDVLRIDVGLTISPVVGIISAKRAVKEVEGRVELFLNPHAVMATLTLPCT